MATLYITEFAELGIGPAGRVDQMAMQPPLVDQAPLVFTGGVQQSAAFNTNTRIVRLNTDASCSILFGTNPTAVTASNARMATNQTEYYAVPKGQAFKVSVIVTP